MAKQSKRRKTAPAKKRSPKAERELRARAADGFTPERRSDFLQVFARTGNMTEAAITADISRPTVYDWVRNDEEFARLFEDARQQAADSLEAEARRRAVEGWDEPVFHKGEECGSIRRYSDALLTLLLKGAKPDKYRERLEHSGDPKRPIVFTKADEMSDDELATIAARGDA